MPCCAPRYGPLIISGIDMTAGIFGLILLAAYHDSPSAWVCILFPAVAMLCLGPTLAIAFLKRKTFLAVVAFWMNIVLVIGCACIILTLWTARRFRESSFTPVFIAAESYIIILQLHFSWVVHDFHANRLRFLTPLNSKRFKNAPTEVDDSYQKISVES